MQKFGDNIPTQNPTFYRENPPPSAVSIWTGLVGLGALTAALLFVFTYQKNAPVIFHVLEILAATTVAMMIFELGRLNQHREKPLFRLPRIPTRASLGNVGLRLLGAFLTIVPFTIGYFVLSEFLKDRYEFLWVSFVTASPVILLLVALYFFITEHLRDPNPDTLWHLGLVALRKKHWRHVPDLTEHWRQWMVKTVFVPFAFATIYATVYIFETIIKNFTFDLLQVFSLLYILGFVVDSVFGTIGYLMSFRFLDSHIRSTQRSILGWMACLICYPPLMSLLYLFVTFFQNGEAWEIWLRNAGVFTWLWAATILLLQGLYAWATVICGFRFSNLTNRGIITNGPYRYFKHPAYLAKNISWWLIFMPFVLTISIPVALGTAAQLLFVNFIYYLRAKTEERHLWEDEHYRAYVRWIDSYGVFARFRQLLLRTTIGKSFFSFLDYLSTAMTRLYERSMLAKRFVR